MRLLACTSIVVVTAASAAAQTPDFNRDIRPILSNACFQCHGPDAKTREAGLRLDDRTAAITELESGQTTIVPGQPAESELIRRVTSRDPDLRMPPADGGDALTQTQIDVLSRWISDGAAYQKHWAFETPQPTNIPPAQDEPWVRNQIDHFVLQQLHRTGLQPAAEATKPASAKPAVAAVKPVPAVVKPTASTATTAPCPKKCGSCCAGSCRAAHSCAASSSSA